MHKINISYSNQQLISLDYKIKKMQQKMMEEQNVKKTIQILPPYITYKYHDSYHYCYLPTLKIQVSNDEKQKSIVPQIQFKTTVASQQKILQIQQEINQIQQKKTKLKISIFKPSTLFNRRIKQSKIMNWNAKFMSLLSNEQFAKARITLEQFNYSKPHSDVYQKLYNKVVDMALQIQFLSKKSQNLYQNFVEFIQNTSAQVNKFLNILFKLFLKQNKKILLQQLIAKPGLECQLQSKTQILEQQVSKSKTSYKQEIQSLERQLKKVKYDLANKSYELIRQNDQKMRVQKELRQKNQLNILISKQIEQLKQKFAKANLLLSSLKNQKDDLDQVIKKLKIKCQDKENLIFQSKKQIEKIKKQKVQSQSLLEDCIKMLQPDSQKKQIWKLQKQKQELECALAKYQYFDQLKQLNIQVDQLKNKIIFAKQEVKRCKQQDADLNDKLNYLQMKYYINHTILENYQKGIKQLQKSADLKKIELSNLVKQMISKQKNCKQQTF